MPETTKLPAHTVRNGITVIYMCPLLDMLFPDGWSGIDPNVIGEATARWLNENHAYYHAWEGPSWMRLAEESRAVDATIADGRTIVVIEALS